VPSAGRCGGRRARPAPRRATRPPRDPWQQGAAPAGEAPARRREGPVRCGRVLAALRTPWTALGGGGGRLLGVRVGLAGRLFCVAAHALLDADRQRAPLLGADQGQREAGQPWHRRARETGKAPIQALGGWARLRGHDFIAPQQRDLISTGERLTKDPPQPHGPRECRGEQALHGPGTAAWARPAGEAPHRHASRHDQQSRNNRAAWTERCSRHGGLAAWPKCSNVPRGFLEVLRCRCGRQQLTTYEKPPPMNI